MLRSTFYSFTTALRGLNTAQKQLDITGQNISNVSTTGYTRQRADVYSAAPSGYGDKYGTRTSTMVGQGVVIGSISQCRDQFLDVRFRREAANLGEEEAKLDTMNDLSLIFDEIENKGLMNSFNDFVSKLQSLANNAESPEFDSIARDAASTLAKQFNQYASQIATVREEKEYNLKEVTGNTLNDLMTNIAGLNKSIREVQCSGGPALELKDERNLMIDQLSNYMKVDVKYDPKELAGGIVVEDVTISMIGENGTKQPLIFNDTSSTFDVKTAGDDGTDKAIVTIDNSALPAKQAYTKINNLLKTISVGNTTLQSINNDLAKLYPGDPTATPAIDPLKYTDLPTKISKVTNSISGASGFNDKIVAANTTIDNARTALSDKLADTVHPPTAAEITALNQDIMDAINAKSSLVTQRDKAIEEKEMLIDYNTEATKFDKSITNCDKSLQATLDAEGITATKVLNIDDYTSCYYKFTDKASGTPITDSLGHNIKWDVGNSYTKLDRDKLAEVGITFTDHFDAEELASPGSLKGSIDMLNSKGIFDYQTNQTRGIGYYESMLDSLADQLANTLNKINDLEGTDTKEYLFQTSDGSSKFTASNLSIADDWLNGKYGITGTKNPQVGDNSAKNDNILLMISTISSKLTYSTGPVPNKDANGNYLKTAADGSTSIVADGKDLNGNYTLTKNSDDTINDPPLLVANENFVNYIDDGAGNTVLDAKLLSKDPSYLAPDGTTVANGKDTDGNYTMTTTDAGGNTTTTIVANPDGIMYKTESDGSISKDKDGNPILDTKSISENYLAPDGTTGANGKDTNGNYTMTTTDAAGKETVTVVANSNGVLYKKEADGTISKDKDGNPILDANESKLDYRSESFLYNGTFQEFLSNISNVLSLDISSTSNLSANHDTILKSIQTSKESISSVSLDEEGVNIMQFQKAYNASARLMTALDEAVERIINQMGTVGR